MNPTRMVGGPTRGTSGHRHRVEQLRKTEVETRVKWLDAPEGQGGRRQNQELGGAQDTDAVPEPPQGTSPVG